MRGLKIAAVTIAACIAAPALAQTSGSRGEADPNQRICRRTPPALGTIVRPRPVCKTRAEWEAESRDAQDSLRRRHSPPSGDDR